MPSEIYGGKLKKASIAGAPYNYRKAEKLLLVREKKDGRELIEFVKTPTLYIDFESLYKNTPMTKKQLKTSIID